MRIIDETGRAASPVRLTMLFMLPFLIALAVLLFAVVAWERQKIGEDRMAELNEVARSFFGQIMVTRIWNARHGGVYVETSPDTPSNPYLDDPEREIVAVSGKRYTKVNPAYMTRQLAEIAVRKHGYKFRIVSLRPLNPYNTPDEWEKSSLREFEKGVSSETATVGTESDGSRSFNYMVPLKTEEPCLKCHAKHGYVLGDIRGGISIKIPMKNSDLIHAQKIRRMLVYLLLTGAVGVLFMSAITYSLSRKLSRSIEKDIEQKKLEAMMELAGATAHELRQPMTVIGNFVSLLNDKLRSHEPVDEEELKIIVDQCGRMNETIKKMLRITSYKTKDYAGGGKIIDFEEASRKDD